MQTVETRRDFLIELKNLLPLNVDAVELGVYRGDFSKMILDIIQPHTLVLVDPFACNEEKYSSGLTTAYSSEDDYLVVQEKFAKEIKNQNVIIDRRFSYDAVNDYADDCFEVIYIDTNHLYHGTKKDLNDWKLKLSIFGFLCGHDFADIADFGVKQAVNEFMEENNFEMVLFNKNGGDFALSSR